MLQEELAALMPSTLLEEAQQLKRRVAAARERK
jgi:hypothetical protein